MRIKQDSLVENTGLVDAYHNSSSPTSFPFKALLFVTHCSQKFQVLDCDIQNVEEFAASCWPPQQALSTDYSIAVQVPLLVLISDAAINVFTQT